MNTRWPNGQLSITRTIDKERPIRVLLNDRKGNVVYDARMTLDAFAACITGSSYQPCWIVEKREDK